MEGLRERAEVGVLGIEIEEEVVWKEEVEG